MAFIALRRSRNTSSYVLVESYRDESGRSRKRTLCYLGREQDGTDTLDNAIAHWRKIERAAGRELRAARLDRQRVLKDRVAKARRHVETLRRHAGQAARVETERRARLERRRAAEEERRRRDEEAEHWQAIERLRHNPTPENAQAAKRAFRVLALRLHPDQGGEHEDFIRLKHRYDSAADSWRRQAS